MRDKSPLPEGVDSFSDLIGLWKTSAEFARAIGLEDHTLARVWKRRNRIPNAWRARVIRAAAARGVFVSHEHWSAWRKLGRNAGY